MWILWLALVPAVFRYCQCHLQPCFGELGSQERLLGACSGICTSCIGISDCVRASQIVIHFKQVVQREPKSLKDLIQSLEASEAWFLKTPLSHTSTAELEFFHRPLKLKVCFYGEPPIPSFSLWNQTLEAIELRLYWSNIDVCWYMLIILDFFLGCQGFDEFNPRIAIWTLHLMRSNFQMLLWKCEPSTPSRSCALVSSEMVMKQTDSFDSTDLPGSTCRAGMAYHCNGTKHMGRWWSGPLVAVNRSRPFSTIYQQISMKIECFWFISVFCDLDGIWWHIFAWHVGYLIYGYGWVHGSSRRIKRR